jgi:SAM-dependent methyltransferase
MEQKRDPDRFAAVAAAYDRWIGWGPRLQKEIPFLLSSIPAGSTVLDVGCGTGAHARALAAAGYRVTGLDRSEAMLEQAKGPGGDPAPEFILGDIADSAALAGRHFGAVLALGNVLHSFRDEGESRAAILRMVERVAPGGTLILQYLNGARIRREGRLVVKATEPSAADAPEEIWLRHHFAAGDEIYFHSYVLRRGETNWSAEVRAERVADLSAEDARDLLRSRFRAIDLFDGLTGAPYRPEESDAIGIRAQGRR